MIEHLIPAQPAMQYDGSNGVGILAEIDAGDATTYSVTIVSEGGGELVIGWDSAGPQQQAVQTGDWVGVGRFPGGLQWYATSDVAAQFVKLSDLT